MANALPLHVPASLAGFLRRDGDWLRCNEPGCGDRAFWGAWRDGGFLRVKVAAHRARQHAGRAVRPQAGRPQRRAAAAQAQGSVLMDVSVLEALRGARLGQGIARVGFDVGAVVLKRARQGQEHHNLAEWHSYQGAPAHIRKWLCPPLAIAPDGSWLLVRKADRVGHVDGADMSALRKALGRWVGDLHHGNVGYVDGQVVATDYANGFDGSTCDWVGA